MTRGSRDDLHGDLAVLGPEIVLQMLAQARASGLLLLASPAAGCWIALRQGRITAAGQGESGPRGRGRGAGSARASTQPAGPSPGSGAASRARKRGQEARAARVPSEAEARKAGAERPPQSLVTGPRAAPAAEGASRADSIREQVRAVLSVALGWRQGEFSFRSGVHPEDEEVQLEVEELLLDCMTRLDRARAGRGGG